MAEWTAIHLRFWITYAGKYSGTLKPLICSTCKWTNYFLESRDTNVSILQVCFLKSKCCIFFCLNFIASKLCHLLRTLWIFHRVSRQLYKGALPQPCNLTLRPQSTCRNLDPRCSKKNWLLFITEHSKVICRCNRIPTSISFDVRGILHIIHNTITSKDFSYIEILSIYLTVYCN